MSITIQSAFTQISKAIQPLYDEREAQNIAHMILEHITDLSKLDRMLHKDEELTPAQFTQLQDAAKALLNGQPVHYVIGRNWFYGMKFFVNEHVLIPRPETEELVEWVVREAKAGTNKTPRIIDIGTGSGCIPIALKKELPDAQVQAIDISPEALDVAKQNAVAQETEVRFEQIDALDPAATAALPTFDFIVSNPPYILESEKAGMMEQVAKFEPSIALFVPDNDGLLFYRAIGKMAQEKLVPGGKLFFEINEALGAETLELLIDLGFDQVMMKQDLYGRDRMIMAIKD